MWRRRFSSQRSLCDVSGRFVQWWVCGACALLSRAVSSGHTVKSQLVQLPFKTDTLQLPVLVPQVRGQVGQSKPRLCVKQQLHVCYWLWKCDITSCTGAGRRSVSRSGASDCHLVNVSVSWVVYFIRKDPPPPPPDRHVLPSPELEPSREASTGGIDLLQEESTFYRRNRPWMVQITRLIIRKQKGFYLRNHRSGDGTRF